jgi:hypothetical protein
MKSRRCTEMFGEVRDLLPSSQRALSTKTATRLPEFKMSANAAVALVVAWAVEDSASFIICTSQDRQVSNAPFTQRSAAGAV